MKFGVALIAGLIITQGSCGGAIIQNEYGNYGQVSNNQGKLYGQVIDYQRQNTNTVNFGEKDQGKGKSKEKSKDKSRDKSSDKSKDKSRDKSRDKSKDKSRDKSKDKSRDKSRDKSSDKSKEKSRDKSREKSRDKEYNNNIPFKPNVFQIKDDQQGGAIFNGR